MSGELCFELATELRQRRLQVADFNADGLVDLAFATPQSPGQLIDIWLNDGKPGFAPAAQIPTGIEGAVTTKWFAAPLDADASADLLLVQLIEGEARINAYLNDGELKFADPVGSLIAGAGEPWNSVSIFDADADGRADLLAEPYSGQGTLHIIANDGKGRFQSSGMTVASHPNCSYTSSAAIPAFGAFTGGLVFVPGECEDVVTSDMTIVLVQMGGDIHSARVSTHGPSPSSAVVADLDGDAELELLLWDRVQQVFGLYQFDFLGNLVFEQTMEPAQLCPDCDVPAEPFALQIGVGNFDGDATGDLALAFGGLPYFGLSPLTDSPSWSLWEDSPLPLTQLLVVDLDDDGMDDVVLVSSVAELSHILANRH